MRASTARTFPLRRSAGDKHRRRTNLSVPRRRTLRLSVNWLPGTSVAYILSPYTIAITAQGIEGPAETIKARRLADVRVLVLDDSADTVEMLRKLLEIEGALAESANSGDEALEILRHKNFDLLITDISMPGMDGFEVFAEGAGRAFDCYITRLGPDRFWSR